MSPITVWFADGEPVKLGSGSATLRVVVARCADINGRRYWRVRACGDDGRIETFNLCQSDANAQEWVLAADGAESAPLGAS
jgi:hypothetical protein